MKFIGFHVEYLEQPSKYEVVYVDDQDLEDYDNLVKNTDKDIIFWKKRFSRLGGEKIYWLRHFRKIKV